VNWLGILFFSLCQETGTVNIQRKSVPEVNIDEDVYRPATANKNISRR
jgi:hypothetical protein